MAGLQYKCPGCGAPINFNPEKQLMTCEYCAGEFSVAEVEEYTRRISAQSMGADQNSPAKDGPRLMEPKPAAQAPADGQEVNQESSTGWKNTETGVWDPQKDSGLAAFVCNSCGGEIIGSPQMVSSRCPYCDNNFISQAQLQTTRRPDRIIPFRKTKEEALDALRESMRGKPFLPKAFHQRYRLQEIDSMYLPYWLYSADVAGWTEFEAKTLRTWTSGDYEYTETKTYAVSRQGQAAFDGVPVYAAENVPVEHTEAIEPFNPADVAEFSPTYLAGFKTNRYTIEPEQANKRANRRIEKTVSNCFRQSITGYDTVVEKYTGINLGNNLSYYSFLPIWMMNIRYGEKIYTFAMNGQTGKVVGHFPVSKLKKWLAFTGFFAMYTALVGAGLYFLIPLVFDVGVFG